ncbi:metallophosphoesterase [Flavobacterium geliluteum]|uniref:Metallophosphoesterase n=1 Tax=Flavobacterium geliluteum TaxID=2816120 RepID=A0A940XAG6_9FLAO|nr:metallophosphoesterase [Flavobacterium geliluteum]MBP4138366.1 metallophosphoesterase [Flavobacterium geliluteum]
MKQLIPKFRYLIILPLILSSCVSSKHQEKKALNNTVPHSENEIEHSFYLIGDAGNAQQGSSETTLKQLKKYLSIGDETATVLFLGDNIYPNGLPEKDTPKRNLAEYQLKLQTESVKEFKGRTIFIPGNHDWYNDGNKGLKREQEFIEKELGKNSFLPKDGCPIKTIDISDDIVLIIVDSQWYITNWDKYPTINDNCELNSRNLFLDEFRSEIKKARGKTTLVAIHHPMFTNGPHGGQYALKDHLKPFPILGTLKNLIRSTSGISNADLSNKFYNELKKNIVAASQQNEKVIFISGHEHNLQYLIQNNIPQIVSGSGSKTSATRSKNENQFSCAENGFALLDIYKNGSSRVRFISSIDNKTEFETQIYQPDAIKQKVEYPIVEKEYVQKSILTIEETTKSKTYNFLWGKRFSEDYSVPVTAKVVYLDTLFGGLTPTRKGGGTQSKTLQLVAKDGKRYVIRAMKKQASQYIQAALFKNQFVGGQFENTFSESLIQHVFTGSYPYIPFVTGNLSNAIDLAHLNSKLYYIPKQKSLGYFNNEFGDELYLFEEHASNGHLELGSGNFTGKILSTIDMMKQIHSDESTKIDEKEYIKARLFDMLIGDWDRHQDQWRWLEFQEEKKTIYKPLPRDRDQAFSRMSDGFILSAAVKLIPTAILLRKYNTDLKDVKGFNIEPYPLDMALIKNSTKEIWDEQVNFIKNNLTDKVVEDAFSNIPKEVNQKTIEELKELFKSRIKNLPLISDRYFKLINKYAVITATNKDDYIKIEAFENGEVSVKIARKKDKTIKDEFHNKMYYPVLTKEIWIYGLDDTDTFEVIGKSKKIKIRLIGGQNNDEYMVENGENIIIYDYKSKKNNFENASKATVRLQDKYNINVYDYKKLKNNTNQLIPIIGANPDDGLKIGAANTFTIFGFERNPFTSQHKLLAAYYFATNGYELNYSAEFANLIGNTNLVIQSKFNSPNFSQNFFGFGNETSNNDDDLSLNYNRVKIREISLAPSLVWKAYGGSRLSLGLKYESIEVEETNNRFVENNTELPSYIFEANQFASINTKFHFENYDNKAYPTNGMSTTIELGYKSSLEYDKINFVYLIPEISFTHKLNATGRLVIATNIKSHINFNNNFEFYQAASIGGTDGLRGFRNQRFSGKQSLYQNTDIRYSFNTVKTGLLPIRYGVYTGFDYGRIWLDTENSKKWNNSYGAGLFINGAEILSANLGVFNSIDGVRFAFSLGFGF